MKVLLFTIIRPPCQGPSGPCGNNIPMTKAHDSWSSSQKSYPRPLLGPFLQWLNDFRYLNSHSNVKKKSSTTSRYVAHCKIVLSLVCVRIIEGYDDLETDIHKRFTRLKQTQTAVQSAAGVCVVNFAALIRSFFYYGRAGILKEMKRRGLGVWSEYCTDPKSSCLTKVLMGGVGGWAECWGVWRRDGTERLSISSTEGGEATCQRISEGWAGGATGVMMYDTMWSEQQKGFCLQFSEAGGAVLGRSSPPRTGNLSCLWSESWTACPPPHRVCGAVLGVIEPHSSF